MLYTLLHTSSPSSLLPSFHRGAVLCACRFTEQALIPPSLSSPLPQVLHGTDALLRLFDTVGLGWAARISELPIINK